MQSTPFFREASALAHKESSYLFSIETWGAIPVFRPLAKKTMTMRPEFIAMPRRLKPL